MKAPSGPPDGAFTVRPRVRAAAVDARGEERHRRIEAGESVDQVAADAADRARQAFDLVEKGLKDCAVRA